MRLLSVALLGCGAQTTPTVTVTPPPAASTTSPTPFSPSPLQDFVSAGCTLKHDDLDCKSAKIDGVDACRGTLHVVANHLDPSALVVQCHADTAKIARGLWTSGCKLTSSVIYFAAMDHRIVRIASAKDLAATFAPVTSPEEAVSFAALVSGDDAFDKERKADDGKTMSTDPTRDGDGWTFDLFRYQSCGCDHPVMRVSYFVARDGMVTEKSHARALENADQSGMCKD